MSRFLILLLLLPVVTAIVHIEPYGYHMVDKPCAGGHPLDTRINADVGTFSILYMMDDGTELDTIVRHTNVFYAHVPCHNWDGAYLAIRNEVNETMVASVNVQQMVSTKMDTAVMIVFTVTIVSLMTLVIGVNIVSAVMHCRNRRR